MLRIALKISTSVAFVGMAGVGVGCYSYKDKNKPQLPLYTIRPDLSKCVVVVTGATSGIGMETARKLASSGATLIIGSRDADRGAKAKVYIESSSPPGAPPVSVLPLDTSSIISVQGFAHTILDKHPPSPSRPFIFVGAAASINTSADQPLSPEGYDLDFHTNHLGLQALISELSPLISSPGCRIVIVGSKLERQGKLDITALKSSSGTKLRETPPDGSRGPVAHYSDTKLANHLLSTHLPKVYPSSTTFIVSPGMVNTGLWRNFTPAYRAVTYPIRSLALRTAGEAAEGVFYACAAESSGKMGSAVFLVDGVEQNQSEKAEDKELAKELFEVCRGLIEKKKRV